MVVFGIGIRSFFLENVTKLFLMCVFSGISMFIIQDTIFLLKKKKEKNNILRDNFNSICYFLAERFFAIHSFEETVEYHAFFCRSN